MNILLIQLKRIGDLILTTPAIAALRQKFPDAKLSLVVSPGCAELLPAIPYIDNHFFAGDWLKIARGSFDCAIDFTRTDRSALLTFISRAERRITSGRKKYRAKLRALAYNELIARPLKFEHAIDSNLALLEPLGINGAAPPVQLDLPTEAHETVGNILSREKIDNDFVVFHPGSARAEKFWEPECWASAIEHCANDLQLACVVTSGNSPMEKAHLAKIKSATRTRYVDLSGQTSLLALAALIEKARLLVTIDSAPVHLAAAMRTPQVALFGPTNPFHWAPRDSPALICYAGKVLRPNELAPERPRFPMKLISTQAVIDAMKSLLSRPTAPAS
ncbi:MAG: heptosyltransferase [Verrucomicrobiota bacterium]